MNEIKDAFGDNRVVHRRSFEVTAVRKNLLVELRLEDPYAGFEPPPGFRAIKKKTSEYKCFGIFEKMVSENMPLQVSFQPCSLKRQAL